MKTATTISAVITLLLMLTAMICGFWLKAGNPGDISFHIGCGVASVVFGSITVVLLVFTLRQIKNAR